MGERKGIRDAIGVKGGLGTIDSFSQIAKDCDVLKGELVSTIDVVYEIMSDYSQIDGCESTTSSNMDLLS